MTFLRSRGLRKLFANRLATVALGVVGLYVLVAIVVLFGGLFAKEETSKRAGPDSTPGWGVQTIEKRLSDARFHLDRVEKALAMDDVGAALAGAALFELRIAEAPPSDLAASVARGWALFDGLVERVDGAENLAFDTVYAEQTAAGTADDEALAIAGTAADSAAEALRADPEFLARLSELEATVESLFAPLAGADAFWYGVRRSLGTDRQGRSIAVRAIYSIKIALMIGAVTAFVSVLFGSVLGAAAAFYGGAVDHAVIWLYSTLSSVPSLVMLIVLGYTFMGGPWENSLLPVYAAFCITFWIGPCRVVRGEALKIKELEYVQAATAVGFSRAYVLLRHVLPNTAHLMFINFSLLFIGAVKSEVILSFLGLGVKNQPSWGTMIRDSRQEVINAFFWQIGTATAFMFVLVMAFNVLSDALQDAFDPKHVS